jgi:NitT/TauT family transport system substrate-binding protein
MKNNQIILLIIIALIFVGGFYFFNQENNKQPTQLEKVTVILPFLPSAEFLPVYTAISNGYYKEQGLDVTISHTAEGSFAAIKQVASDASNFSYSIGGDSLITARSQNIPVVAVYQTEHANMFGVISKKDANITTPQQLVNESIAMPGAGAPPEVATKAILKNSGIDPNKAKFVYVGGDLVKSFLTGNTKVIASYLFFEELFKSMGIETNSLYAKDYGANFPTGLTITSEDMIKNKKDVVQKFVNATNKGLKYAISNSNLAIDSYVKNFNSSEAEADKAVEISYWNRLVKEQVQSDKFKLGQLDKTQFETTNDVLLNIGVITSKIDISKAYTTEFLPK